MTKDAKMTTTMPTKSYADAASPTTETLDGHGFTQVKASKSPGRKKETNADNRCRLPLSLLLRCRCRCYYR